MECRCQQAVGRRRGTSYVAERTDTYHDGPCDRGRLGIHDTHGTQGVKEGLLDVVISDATYSNHASSSCRDIMQDMDMVGQRFSFLLYT